MSAADRAYDVLHARTHGRVERALPIGPMTSYGLGGPASVFFEPATPEDLPALSAAVAASELPLLMLGRGSNLLVSDRGFDGIAVRLGAGFRWTRVEGSAIAAGAAVPLPTLAVLSGRHALTGIEFAIAIPASVGGAVRMNAGAHGHEVGEALASVEVFRLEAAEAETIPAARLGFSYRSSDLPRDAIVTGAHFALAAGDDASIQERLREAREWRRANQPLNLPNAGSVFTNPPGDAAGRIIERVCGKGMSVGGARISEVHANFIVAAPDASADDVYTLIRRIQRRVKEEAGVELVLEVRLVGQFEEVPDGAAAR
ncbi:MAG: UDP-N-acetylmuramate dehydrogenase [Actinobacteria bacterium]|nr:MAG: UDP-N-acetylmuramate dehydrogenase [Actinomycetota bacterium]